MKKHILIFITAVLSAGFAGAQSHAGVTTLCDNGKAVIENSIVRLVFDLGSGHYSAYDLRDGSLALSEAVCMVDGYSTAGYGSINAEFVASTMPVGDGISLRITAREKDKPSLLFAFTLVPGRDFIIMEGGIENTSSEPVQVRSIRPVSDGLIFPGRDLSVNFTAIDGEGGGASTYIRKYPSLSSQNNTIVHFGGDDDFRTLVAGGVSYHEFAKFAQVGSLPQRERLLAEEMPHGLRIAAYHDLGSDKFQPAQDKATARPYISVENVDNYTFESSAAFDEAKSIVFSYNEIPIEFGNFDTSRDYAVGISWVDDERSREQKISLTYCDKVVDMVAGLPVPSLDRLEAPEIVYFNVPADAVRAGSFKVVIKHTAGANAVASEAVLFEGDVPDAVAGRPFPVNIPPAGFDDVTLQLYADDFVGKRVDPGQIFMAWQDLFYLGFGVDNPLEAAEQYADVLQKLQGIELNHYYFPTICLWYAMEPKFGGNIVLGKNDSPGAVAEMQRVKESGWLKYSTMGIRLVPDCYGDNNENGWWDDEHWQKYGSGNQVPEMTLEGAHYRAPYETTKKWAQAVTDLGGKPFTYFQTAVRSNDYAEQFPEHMLFNDSYHEVPTKDWLNKNYSSYDFTDPGFYAHMQDVYRNLHDGGIQGMMFDYPYTAWPVYGGMEDKYSTTAGAYRTVYQLSRDGLGKDAYIHERNLKYGSDIALGLVSSQRTWGDTDIITSEMVMRSGLRWYKNRVVVNYDMDAKNLVKASQTPDALNKLLTMSYVTASRLLLANSFGSLDGDIIYSLSRVFPFHETAQSARPLDAFSAEYPSIYGMRISDDWLSLTFYNEDDDHEKTLSFDLSGTEGRGGAGLDAGSRYYIYDFWNDGLIGVYNGSDRFTQTLRKGEARQMAVRRVENHPQVLSTDRHLMQGWLELSDITWDGTSLSGKAQTVEGEPMEIIIAGNGSEPRSVAVSQGTAAVIRGTDPAYFRIRIENPAGGEVEWKTTFR